MTQQHESRWSLNHTGNRVALAVVVGLVVGACANSAGLSTGAHVAVIVVVGLLTYVLATVLRRR